MAPRSELHDIFVEILGSDNVYFQAPTNIGLAYPCIKYQLNDVDTKFADNNPYAHEKGYLVTVIDRNPDTTIPEKIMKLPKCLFDRHYVVDNLNHYAFRIYF